MRKLKISMAAFILFILLPILGGYSGNNILGWLITCLCLLGVAWVLLIGTGAFTKIK